MVLGVIIYMNPAIFKYVNKPVIFAVLFISLLMFVLNSYEKREEKLMQFLQTQSETNTKIATTLEKLDIRMCSIEARLQQK